MRKDKGWSPPPLGGYQPSLKEGQVFSNETLPRGGSGRCRCNNDDKKNLELMSETMELLNERINVQGKIIDTNKELISMLFEKIETLENEISDLKKSSEEK